MSVLYSYSHRKEQSTGATYFYGGQPLPSDSNVILIIYLCVTMNFIETWIKKLNRNIAWNCLAFQDNMKEKFQKFLKK